MPLEPETAAVLETLAAAGFKGQIAGLEEGRRGLETISRMLGLPPVAVGAVEDRHIAGPAGPIPVRIYTPQAVGARPTPALVYFHGGGWVRGSIESHDSICRFLCKEAAAVVMSVGYRLAPEYPFPAAVEDACAAACWFAEHAAEFGADPARVAIGGDSAGGNLATVVCLLAPGRFWRQLLIYPATDHPARPHPSLEENGAGFLLTKEVIFWFAAQYFQKESDRDDFRGAPVLASLADLRGLPPALVITAEYDPIRDDGELYAARMQECGVPVELVRYPGTIHGFVSLAGAISLGKTALFEVAAVMASSAMPSVQVL
jgi:acetyl esterase